MPHVQRNGEKGQENSNSTPRILRHPQSQARATVASGKQRPYSTATTPPDTDSKRSNPFNSAFPFSPKRYTIEFCDTSLTISIPGRSHSERQSAACTTRLPGKSAFDFFEHE